MVRKINIKVPYFSEEDKRIIVLGDLNKALEFKRKMNEENVSFYGEYNYKIFIYSNELMNVFLLFDSRLFLKLDENKIREIVINKRIDIAKKFKENRNIYYKLFGFLKEFEMYFKSRKYRKCIKKVREIVNCYYENNVKDFYLSRFYEGILKRISYRLRKLVKRRIKRDKFLLDMLDEKVRNNGFAYWGLNFFYDKDGIEFVFSFVDIYYKVFQEFLRFKVSYKDFLKFKDELKKYLLVSSI